jgi:predicted branched-subunit amino acid permease
MKKWQIFKQGVLQELPLQLGVFPFGIIYGVMAIESGLTFLQALLMSSIIFGGASQIAFVQLLSNSTPYGVIVTTVGAINSRHLLYSISMVEYLNKLSLSWRVTLAYLLTDEAYAVSIRKFINNSDNSILHYHLLGSGITLFLSWQISTLLGVWLGNDLPEFLDLQFIIPLTFIAIIIPMIKSKSTLITVISSGISALIFKNLDINFWIILSGLTGILAGMASSRWDKKS